MAKTISKVRARATLHHGHPDGRVQIVNRGEEFELDTQEAERLHAARLADIIGEPTTPLEEPPPLQTSRGKKSVAPGDDALADA